MANGLPGLETLSLRETDAGSGSQPGVDGLLGRQLLSQLQRGPAGHVEQGIQLGPSAGHPQEPPRWAGPSDGLAQSCAPQAMGPPMQQRPGVAADQQQGPSQAPGGPGWPQGHPVAPPPPGFHVLPRQPLPPPHAPPPPGLWPPGAPPPPLGGLFPPLIPPPPPGHVLTRAECLALQGPLSRQLDHQVMLIQSLVQSGQTSSPMLPGLLQAFEQTKAQLAQIAVELSAPSAAQPSGVEKQEPEHPTQQGQNGRSDGEVMAASGSTPKAGPTADDPSQAGKQKGPFKPAPGRQGRWVDVMDARHDGRRPIADMDEMNAVLCALVKALQPPPGAWVGSLITWLSWQRRGCDWSTGCYFAATWILDAPRHLYRFCADALSCNASDTER